MDHFENIIATLLEADGYWVRQSFKVNLTREEKVRIGKPSIAMRSSRLKPSPF